MSLSMWVDMRRRMDELEKRVAELEQRKEPEKRGPGRPAKQPEQVN